MRASCLELTMWDSNPRCMWIRVGEIAVGDIYKGGLGAGRAIRRRAFSYSCHSLSQRFTPRCIRQLVETGRAIKADPKAALNPLANIQACKKVSLRAAEAARRGEYCTDAALDLLEVLVGGKVGLKTVKNRTGSQPQVQRNRGQGHRAEEVVRRGYPDADSRVTLPTPLGRRVIDILAPGKLAIEVKDRESQPKPRGPGPDQEGRCSTTARRRA